MVEKDQDLLHNQNSYNFDHVRNISDHIFAAVPPNHFKFSTLVTNDSVSINDILVKKRRYELLSRSQKFY